MSVILGLKPFNAISPGTVLNGGTKSTLVVRNFAPSFLFLCACAATLTIWNPDPLGDRIYECSILSLAGALLLGPGRVSWRFCLPLTLVAVWGYLQSAAAATIYRSATVDAALRFSALAATAFVAYRTLSPPRLRERFLQAFAWFGFLLSVMGVLAYYTSRQQILWLFEAPYPDVWGPFLSRNNFAQFLELAMPAALWLAFRKPASLLYWSRAASMLAAGLVSASRAGAIMLTLQAMAMFWYYGRKQIRWAAAFVATVAFLGAFAGADTLLDRLQSSEPLAYRTPIYQSSLEMIAAHPLQGSGLGTFEWAYPEFARFDPGYRVEHAHNDWLEWAAEGGLGFSMIWAILAIRATFFSSRNPWALGVPAIFLHALVDFPFARFGVAAWLFILLGALEGAEEGERR
jgi:O-antigen ligase